MNKRTLRILISAAAIGVLLVVALLRFQLGSSTGKVKASSGPYSQLNQIQKRILSGTLDNVLDTSSSSNPQAGPRNYTPDHADDQCALHLGNNTKVNQNCLNLSDPDLQGRAQAQNETSIAEDPLNPSHIVASFNDYRRGDGNCYGSYTLDAGAHWNDTTIPIGFTRGAPFGAAREYWEASGDTAVAWDTRGNAYFQCMVFQRGQPTTNNPDASSAIYVFRSTQNFGASWNFPARPVFENADPTGTSGILEDKPYMTVDNHVSSRNRDTIYVTWTEFAADGSAYIWESHSTNFGETFSPRVLVSATSPLCVNTFGAGTPHGTCNENQFSDPFTGSDGALYVVWDNFNNSLSSATDNHNQILLAKSTDGGNTFSPPILVANYNDLPDCATYQAGQDFGRACVPEKGTATNSVFRASNYPSGAVDPTNSSNIIVTFGSYINKDSNPSNGCTPNGFAPSGNNAYIGVKTAGACNNKILESVSTNGGVSFNGTITDPTTLTVVSSASGQTFTDQWWQWEAFTKGGKLAVSYYDRQYGTDETTGNMDFSLSGSVNDPSTFKVVRVTSSSMPLPTQFPDPQGNSLFFGDYTGLTAVNTAYPLWMDTRDKDLFFCLISGLPGVCTSVSNSGILDNDQDIFSSNVGVP